MTRFVIDGCRCTGLSFARLLELGRSQQLDLPALQQMTRAGRLCKHCRPWLLQAWHSGCDQFEEDSSTLPNGEVLIRHFCPEANKR